MAMDVKVLGRIAIPGGGFTTAGAAKNNKELVVAEVSVTSYTASGEPFAAVDLGLSTIDVVLFNVVSVNNAATAPASGAIPMAEFDRAGGLLILNIDHGADTAVSTGEAAVVRCLAFGDSARTADLT